MSIFSVDPSAMATRVGKGVAANSRCNSSSHSNSSNSLSRITILTNNNTTIIISTISTKAEAVWDVAVA